jgi:hypothetical protein
VPDRSESPFAEGDHLLGILGTQIGEEFVRPSTRIQPLSWTTLSSIARSVEPNLASRVKAPAASVLQSGANPRALKLSKPAVSQRASIGGRRLLDIE